MMTKPDKRIWTPDETCIPFHLEASTDPLVNRLILKFGVKPRHSGVIRSLGCQQSAMLPAVATALPKNVAAIKIAREDPRLTGLSPCLSLNGGLSDVVEASDNTTTSEPGFILPYGIEQSIVRPVCIPLEQGIYYVYQGGTDVSSSMSVFLFGWTWVESANA